MGPQPTVTNVLFDAFLRCKMKAHLLADGAEGADTAIPRYQHGLTKAFEQSALQHLRLQVSDGQVCEGMPPLRAFQFDRYHLIINPVIAVPGLRAEVHALERVTVGRVAAQHAFCPVRFVPNAKLTRLDKLAVAFDALALSRLTGCLPPIAKIIHGPDCTATAVRLPKLVDEAQSYIAELRAQQASAAGPPVILNKHCPACEFQSRCHQVATEQDDLSLIKTINQKEWAKQHAKGIFTVTQLSYTYRPRRRRAHSSALRLKHEPALKALAIRKQRVHVVGRSCFTIPANAVYFDVEGIPDRDFYYLVGLRYRRAGLDVQEAFWADDLQGERQMWAASLRALTLLLDPVLVHFGSYETEFLKHMKARYYDEGSGDLVSRLITSSVNVLSPLHAQVYFPTYSNSLKDIARYLGYRWSDANASGLHALMWRSEWETSRDPNLKRKLITYNAEDCEAAQRVAEAVTAICSEQESEAPEPSTSVNVESLGREHPKLLGRLHYSRPEFKEINEAAYWDYQRSRVYTRSNPRLKNAASQRISRKKTAIKARSVHMASVRPLACANCGWRQVSINRTPSKLVYDLRFYSTGVMRSLARYSSPEYRCPACGSCSRSVLPDRFGRNLRSYIAYQIVELHMSLQSVAEGLESLFGISLSCDQIARIKSKSAAEYCELYRRILRDIVAGSVVHADETKITVDKKLGYVWVFANLESVAYVFSDTRDAGTLRNVLGSFAGVLVSDFYAAYDGIDTAQQKCLIHLLRDINEDVLRNPFNGEMEEVARSFAGLVKPMVDTIDRFGLKAWHLRKHKTAVESFFRRLQRRTYQTEVVIGYKKRFEKNRDKLFTFLDHDGVPWNNNNAEHAIKSVAQMRRAIGSKGTTRNIKDALVLLSIKNTCKYRGVNFLDFLRFGDMGIDVFAARSSAREALMQVKVWFLWKFCPCVEDRPPCPCSAT